MKLFVKIFLFLPLLIMLIAVNYFVDPADLFHYRQNEETIARFLTIGKPVVMDLNKFNVRWIKKHYLEKDLVRKNIILGSSRSLEISSNLFHLDSFFNDSVPIATLEDYLAFYWLQEKNNGLPEKVFIELTPWLLFPNNKLSDNDKLITEYREMLAHLGIDELSGNGELLKKLKSEYSQLFSLAYFQNSIFKYKGYRSGVEDNEEEETVMWPDGSVIYGKSFFGQTDTIRAKAVRGIDNSLNLISSQGPELFRQDILEKFLEHIRQDGVSVVGFLLPYHPLTYNGLKNTNSNWNIDIAENYFRDLADQKKILLIGSYNPDKCRCVEEDFYDGIHTKISGLKKVFSI